MGLGLSLTTFSPGSTISSSSMNSNFSSINNAALPNDSGAISTDGSGVITSTGLIIGSSEHITLGSSSTIRFTDGTTTNDVLYVEAAGHTDIQTWKSGGKVNIKDNSANTFIAFNPSSHGLQYADSNSVLHDVLYVNTGANETYLQLFGNAKLKIKDQNGNDLASLDTSGNWKTKGTQTASTTP